MFDPTTLTGFHTWLSLVAIATGFLALADMHARRETPWTYVFLGTATATSVTGFLFPFVRLLPSHIVGVIALAVLAAMLVARFRFAYAGPWRYVYSIGMVVSVWLLAFVGVAQAFAKVGLLRALAPTQSEAPFAIVQLAVLIGFAVAGARSVRAFRT